MSDPLDVSLRIHLKRAGFDEGKRDIEELRRAADRLGTTRGADELGRDIAQTGKVAERAEKNVQDIARAVDRLANNSGAERLGKNFGLAVAKIESVERAVRDIGRAIETVDREKLDKLRGELTTTTTKVGELERKLREAACAKRPLEETGGAASFLALNAGRAFTAIAAFASVDQIISGLSRVEKGFRDVDRAAASTAMTAEMRDPATRARIIDENKKFGRELGVRQDGVSGARQVFTSGGIIDPAAQTAAMVPTLRAAVASGASPETIASAGRAFMGTMGGKASELGAAYDIMAKGGKVGTFELGDLAKALPQLGTQYAATGGTGLQGLAELTAMAQIAAKGAGSSDEAANNLSNYLAKIFSPETIGNFKDKRVNLPRVIQQGREKGQHPALSVLDEAMRITEGDPIKMGQLFGDMQVMNALRPLMQNRDELNRMTGEIRGKSAGTVAEDYAYVQTTPSGQADRRAAEREAAGVEIGEALNPGASAVDRAATSAMRGGAHIAQGFNEGGTWEGLKRVFRAQSPLSWLWNSTNRGDQPSSEDIEARKTEAEQLASEIARDRAAIASSGRSRNWMAESRLSVKQNRYDELMGDLRSDLGAAEAGKAAGQSTAELETRIQSLTQAIRDLEKKLGDAGTGGVNPISFGGGEGQPRLWNASLGGRGGGVGGSSGGFRSAYSGGAAVLDGMANLPPGAGAAAGAGSPRGRVSVTSNPGGAAGEVFDVLSADFNDAQSLALLGHMQQESSFDPTSWNAKEGAGGILQWRGNRLENLKRFAADRGMNWQDRKVQAAFVSHEMRADPYERQRSARFRSATTIEEASGALKDYVRFGDGSAGTRLGNARRFAEEFGAKSTGAGALPGNVSYANGGATRNREVTPELLQSIGRGVSAVYGEGYRAEIYSGGQDARGRGGRRTGSTRHDDHGHGGRAADLYVYGPDGRKVTGEELAKLGQHWAATGEGGVGMEMRGGGIHLDEHKDRARHWNYRAQGGSYTPAQAERMRQGLAGVAPDYANPSALDPASVAAATGELPAGRLPKPTPRPTGGSAEGPTPTMASRARGQGGPIQITQKIYGSGDPRLAAARAQREQHRAIRMAESGAMHDTMVPIS